MSEKQLVMSGGGALAAQGANTAPSFFVRDGKLATSFGESDDFANQVALQADGKILVGGRSNGAFAVARYHADGSLDTSFSIDGKLTTTLGLYTYGQIIQIAPQADGKILVTGLNAGHYASARYLANGELDATFGQGGIMVSTNSGFDFEDVVVLDNAKVLVAGAVYDSAGADLALVRYKADGSLDTSFDGDGKLTIDLGKIDEMARVLPQADGKVLLVGTSYGATSVTLMRFAENGSPDASFGSAGKVVTELGFSGVALDRAVTLQSDGKILVAGAVESGGYTDSFVLRYHADGRLDTSFNKTGMVFKDIISEGIDKYTTITVQPDGKILVGGYGYTLRSTEGNFIVSRFNADGSLDTGFGTNGTTATPLSANTYFSTMRPNSLLVQPDGKILAVGGDSTSNSDFLIVRYNPDGSLDQTFSPLANTLDGAPTFREGEYAWFTPVVLDDNVQILDAELAAGNYGGASLTLRRHEGSHADDKFGAKSDGTLSALTAGSYFSVDGVTIGRVTTNGGGTLTLSFASTATQALVNKAMQQITYWNLSDAPPAKVQIDWTFNDGNTGGQGTGGALQVTGSTTVEITATNDAPQIDEQLPNQKLATGVFFSYTIPADSFHDPDNEVLSYSILMDDGSGAPPWLTFDAATRTLSGTPSAHDAGTLALRVVARDAAGLTAFNPFHLTIEASANQVNGTEGADMLAGAAGNDVIQGYGGNDTLDGKAGADMMVGGDGNDIYYVDNAADVVSETSLASGGTDTVYSFLELYALAPNVENVRAMSSARGDLIGNELKNVLYAGSGNNLLDGGMGEDTASYMYATAGVTVSLSALYAQETDGSGIDTLVNIEHLNGSRFDDNLLGNGANNVLNGGAGSDFMAGGNGSDTYYVDDETDIVRETNANVATGGTDLVLSSASFTLGAHIEHLTLTGSNAINGTGNTLANRLTGNSGNNVLDGGAGADVLTGGLGNDTYHIDHAADTVIESADAKLGGIDTLVSTVTRTLGDYQENLTLAGNAAINATGNGLANTLIGNAAANVINGGAGADNMKGGLGNDTYHVDNAADLVTESADAELGGVDTVISTVSYILGNYLEQLALSGTAAINATGNALGNKLVGNSGANTLQGGAGADVLSGGAGNDRLLGGTGRDVLEGGAGNDVFDFNTPAETGVTSATWDVIRDFVRGQDRIDLSTIDANTATTANEAFSGFIAAGATFTAAGQLRFSGGVLYGNIDGDSEAEFAIALTGITQLTAADLVL